MLIPERKWRGQNSVLNRAARILDTRTNIGHAPYGATLQFQVPLTVAFENRFFDFIGKTFGIAKEAWFH